MAPAVAPTGAQARYVEAPPSASLAGHATCVWLHAAGDERHVQRVLPDGCADIVFVGGRLIVAGPATRPVLAQIAAGERAVGVRFGPGAAGAALGVPARELRDRSVALEELWGAGARDLADRLAASSGRETAALLAGAVARRLRDASAPDVTVAVAAGLLARGTAITDAALAAGLGERHLRRRFHDAVGYGPKTLQRVLRLRRFLALAEAAPGDGLARAAAEAGYADQPHLTRDCRRLAGLAPAALLASRRSLSIGAP